jgi:hypothetical protein
LNYSGYVDTRFLINDQIFKIKIKFAFCPAVSSESFDLRLHTLSIQIKHKEEINASISGCLALGNKSPIQSR